ncbi:hypothetical protein BCON_0459g00070 [Botryotinia convoluta]|uniref:Uncharacterized protein n=1 Tax=Botryotinia convoluta TaxID=54673 RepID=A0A4Z1HHY5_9HELO|nr:hypothetical protein BCON_0459g00070 [Botryotinia convoluta]
MIVAIELQRMRSRECTESTQGWGIELEDQKAIKPIELYLLRHANEEECIGTMLMARAASRYHPAVIMGFFIDLLSVPRQPLCSESRPQMFSRIQPRFMITPQSARPLKYRSLPIV